MTVEQRISDDLALTSTRLALVGLIAALWFCLPLARPVGAAADRRPAAVSTTVRKGTTTQTTRIRTGTVPRVSVDLGRSAIAAPSTSVVSGMAIAPAGVQAQLGQGLAYTGRSVQLLLCWALLLIATGCLMLFHTRIRQR